MRDDGRTKAQLIAELASLRLQHEKTREQEGKLRASEERYRNFVENAADGYAEYDAGGWCIFCNEAACALVGLTRDEYMEQRYQDLFAAKEEAASAMKAVREIQQTGQTTHFIFTHLVRKDGTTRVVEASVSLIRDAQGKATGFRSITRDLTDRKKIEAERDRYRTFVDNIDDGCYEFDLDGNILFCNEGLPRIFGYSREEFLRLDRWERHIDREYGKHVFRLYDQMYKNNVSSSILEYKILRRDAKIRDYEASVSIIRNQAGQAIGYRGIGRDITQRKQMEDEQRRYREFFENVDDVCAEYDLTGRCTFCNQAAVRIFGYSKEELMRLRHHERFPNKQEADKVYNAFHEIYVKALPVNIVVAEFLCKDGKIKSLEAVMSLIRDAGGHPAGFRSIGRDVTERRTMEQELARYRDFMESIEDSCAEFDLG
ncbi:MAG: PAS domain S-box protein, partial [Deltaproteobacteria bacterium]|nr:PAS domain S-box protein [Deltaproteobacteria bacterium]